MTYTEEFIPVEEGAEIEEAPNYPSAFGITFTPPVSGALFAVLGLLGAAYLVSSLVMPSFQTYQEAQTKLEETKLQIQGKQASQQKIDEAQAKLKVTKQQQTQVLSLFANERTLDTLLLDINRIISSRQGSLQSFVPAQEPPTVVTDGSLGLAVNGKLKRQGVAVQLQGSYDQIQSIMRSIERLQTLLLVRDFKADLAEENSQKFVVNRQGNAVLVGQPTLNTAFNLEVLVPLTPEETAAAAATAAQPPPQ